MGNLSSKKNTPFVAKNEIENKVLIEECPSLSYRNENIWLSAPNSKEFLELLMICSKHKYYYSDCHIKSKFTLDPRTKTLSIDWSCSNKTHGKRKKNNMNIKRFTNKNHSQRKRNNMSIEGIPYINYSTPSIYVTEEYPCNIRIAQHKWWNVDIIQFLSLKKTANDFPKAYLNVCEPWNSILNLEHSDAPVWLNAAETKKELDLFNNHRFTFNPELGVMMIDEWKTDKDMIRVATIPYASYSIPFRHSMGEKILLEQMNISFCPIGIRIPRKDLRNV